MILTRLPIKATFYFDFSLKLKYNNNKEEVNAMKKYEQPYEQGYYDGYQDCKNFYKKLLLQIEKDKKNYEAQIRLLEYKLRYALEEKREDEKIIALGKAVKTLIEEHKK